MFGSDVDNFIVYSSNRGEGQAIFSESGNKGQSWITTERDAAISFGERV